MYVSDLKHPAASLEDKLRQLYTLNRDHKIDLGFRTPYLQLLQQFGNPHLKLPPVIHVAGTNGKGSTIAFMRSILEAAGYKVHSYTSPHLVSFNERIYLAGKNISDGVLEDLVDEALHLNNSGQVTFFEITTAMAFAAFSRVPADILLLEVGLGGRLDCTNVIEKPLVSVITSISWDHQEHLGQTLRAIAGEKAGIIKKHAPCVIGHQGSEALSAGIMDVFESILKSNESKGFIYGSEWFTEPTGDQIQFVFNNQRLVLPPLALCGAHQIHNAGAALTALKIIEEDFPAPDTTIMQGLKTAYWPARLQQIKTGPLTRLLPPDWELWLDGGHNPDAAQVLNQQAQDWQKHDSKPLHMILGMMNHKNPADFAALLRPVLQSLHCINIPGEPQAFTAPTLIKAIGTAHQAENMEDAIKTILRENPQPGRILIAGSLYLAGHVLKHGHN